MLTELKVELLLATNNAGKVVELQQLLQELSFVAILTPMDLGLDLDVEETGLTYQENAALKAEAFMQASGLPTLADDSGLEVAALDGAPGLHSKRFSPEPGATDSDRRSHLLKKLAAKSRPWKAQFIAWAALSLPGQDTRFWRGTCPGEIIPEERGINGFGYDPIFFIPEKGRTMAELSDAEKNALSHRGNAVRAALPDLRSILEKHRAKGA